MPSTMVFSVFFSSSRLFFMFVQCCAALKLSARRWNMMRTKARMKRMRNLRRTLSMIRDDDEPDISAFLNEKEKKTRRELWIILIEMRAKCSHPPSISFQSKQRETNNLIAHRARECPQEFHTWSRAFTLCVARRHRRAHIIISVFSPWSLKLTEEMMTRIS